jgi:uncharacterized membrane protein
MTVAFATRESSRNYGKWALFGVMAVMAVAAIVTDEKFLIVPSDREWTHIAPFRWWLLPHGLAGATALLLGPFQFSDRIRRTHVALHRLMGRIYLGAICIASLLSIYITLNYEPRPFQVEIWAQGGGWLLCAVMAFTFAVKRNIVLHRQWVARSYGFTFIFIMARVPDAFNVHWKNDVDFVNFLWLLVFFALVTPDLILQSGELFRIRTKLGSRGRNV